jgi:hypothetical protein
LQLLYGVKVILYIYIYIYIKVVGTRKTHTSKWEALVPFGQCMHHLPMDVGRLSKCCSKHRIALYIMISHVLAFIVRQSSGDNPLLFSFFSASKGVLALQSTFDFLCFFLSNLILIILISIYFAPIFFWLDYIFWFNP